MNILLTIAYDGTNYCGWQRQDNAVAVQQRLEEALAYCFDQVVNVAGASRTDAGVHALGQRAAFSADKLSIPIDKLPLVINSHLPKDIVVQSAKKVKEEFNPRFDAKAKTYCYQIYNAPYSNPLLCRYSAFVPGALNTDKMAEAAAQFIGTYDFAAFCASGSGAKTTVRTIFDCSVSQEGSLIRMSVTGDGFLYNMVRIMAGTILYAGMGKIEDISGIIASGDRKLAGKTMPPEGLTLMEVMYGEEL